MLGNVKINCKLIQFFKKFLVKKKIYQKKKKLK